MTSDEVVSERGRQFYRAMEAELASGELDFPTSMDLGMRIRRALEDPDCGAEDVARLVNLEPLLAAHVVRIANSAMYHPSGADIADLRSAVMRIGVNNVKPLALSLITRQIAQSGTPATRRAAEQLWRHTIEVAALAWAIAVEVPSVNAEQALYAGLVHKLGSFYLIARAKEYPELLAQDGELSDLVRYWSPRVSREVLIALGTPTTIADAVEESELFFEGWPPRSLSDVLYIANVSADTSDPFADEGGISRQALAEEAFGGLRGDELRRLLQRASARRAEALAVLTG